MGAADDFARTRELRKKRKPERKGDPKTLLEVSCGNLDCRYSYMVELSAAADYPAKAKCPKCGGEAEVKRIR